ncbi:hypothetical protein TTHERM_00607260 (macronuclear) [Tetrahymena thermophila SB210]|uniref:Uncharacterized protein n=1 Tax=Tetrahymena thermophila (strain SB210) TaxID=312017 RepID=Q22YG5_TETTS|nr:hypothetical protein TTHERM_00607260 [Tetrahymena thermophila SB210]EAR90320.1 hypothetical protein TTHERM_00607260 [Tetrahymena thermophila SB210]|eukprot:XP_001010565.1 hypothetical protein TTHERM_00607260 [Tetrahymena thermophila SB210]
MKNEQIIMKNILFLVQTSQKTLFSQRNLLNKWFQDSIKNYIMEQMASSLIAQGLKCSSSVEVKQFIRKNIDKSKPKYMGIIEQYFFYVDKFNKGQAFMEKLNQIIQNPKDITQKENKYNDLKLVRKQFVCLLLLKFFESYGKIEITSFYQLWNSCFPQEIQTKKKLSKFDKREDKQINKRKYTKKIVQSDLSSSSNLQQSVTSLNFSTQIGSIIQETSTDQNSASINNLDQSHVTLPIYDEENNNCIYHSQRQPINNGIFDEDSQEESFNYYDQIINYNTFCQQGINSCPLNQVPTIPEQNKNQYDFCYEQQDQYYQYKNYYYQHISSDFGNQHNFLSQQLNTQDQLNIIDQDDQQYDQRCFFIHM